MRGPCGVFPRTNQSDKPRFLFPAASRWATRGVGSRVGPPSPSLPPLAGPSLRYLRRAVRGSGGLLLLLLLLLLPARLRRRGGGGGGDSGGGAGNPGGGGGARGWLLSSPGRLRGPYLGPPRLGQCAAWNWARMAAPLTSAPARCESARRDGSARRPWA